MIRLSFTLVDHEFVSSSKRLGKAAFPRSLEVGTKQEKKYLATRVNGRKHCFEIQGIQLVVN